MTNEVKALPPNQVVRLLNLSCAYCGTRLSKDVESKEHVIGRRFVPKGKLDKCWNIILNCCSQCNNLKSDLEDDISAITMQPDAFGNYGHNSEVAALDARRKAKSANSRRTGKSVLYSEERTRATMRLRHGVSMTVEFTGPPQIDHRRVFELARMQLVGFFYWITYQENGRQGYWWPGGFCPYLYSSRSDWGNASLRAFGEAVEDWDVRVLGTSAGGFYKVAIRKAPEVACWSWALEWNHALRVVGFFGDMNAAKSEISKIPEPKMKLLARTPEATFTCPRRDTVSGRSSRQLVYVTDNV